MKKFFKCFYIISERRERSSVFQGWEKRHWRLGEKMLSSYPVKTKRQIFKKAQ